MTTTSAALLCSCLVCAQASGNGFKATPELPPKLDCLLEPRVTTDISTRAEGVVERFFVDRGDMVEAGQVVVTLDAAVEQATVALAKTRTQLSGDLRASAASLSYGKAKAARFDGLYQQKAVAENARDEARTEAELAAARLLKAQEERRLAELQLQQAEATLALRTIHSPVTGVVVDRLLDEGESVEDRAILQIAQIDPLHVEVIVPVQYFGSVRPGMGGVVRPELPIGGEHQAVVTVVDRVIDAASGTFRVRLELPNPDHKLPAGLKCDVTFTPSAAVVRRPVEAVEQPAAISEPVPDAGAPTAAPVAAEDPEPAEMVAAAQPSATPATQAAAEKATRVVAHNAEPMGMDELKALQARLREQGIHDTALLRRGRFADHLSFGVFSQIAMANERCAQLQRLGVDCTISSL
jgi:RND family efflux transporter MFP subunit